MEMAKDFGSLVPRSGLAGLWDRLIGPGATPAENTLIVVSSIAGTFGAVLRLWWLGFDPLHLVIGAILSFDILGGAVCNATDTTKRWYHRPEVTWVQHLAFVLLHLTHVAIVSWLFRDSPQFDWHYFGLISSYLLIATLVVVSVRSYLKRPIAAGLYLVVIAIELYGISPTPGIEWFIPTLFLKLLIGHLVPEQLQSPRMP
ncbi:hypothetical protein [Leptolyngbya sp. FACHB-711]|uniref:hypothetical protein n=2 Tax=Leptolyngbya TaxID=47251 RepID=UPI0016835719|nr:hypothetical protein [Leptolyngbya sp. FACHB-711]